MKKETMEKLLEILEASLDALRTASEEAWNGLAELEDDDIDELSNEFEELDCCNFAQCREEISNALNELGFAQETLEYAVNELKDKIYEAREDDE